MKFPPSKAVSLFILMSALGACGFDGDVLRKYLPPEAADAASLYNERDILFCAVSIYHVPENDAFDQLPLTKPDRLSTDWLPLPIDGQMDPASFAVQALFTGNDCFDSEAKRIVGLGKLSEYYSSDRQGFFIELRRDLILVHDTELDLIVISSRAR